MQLQKVDETLKILWQEARSGEDTPYRIRDELLVRLDTSPMGSERELIVVPADLRKPLFSVAHSLSYAGHLGVKKTTAKLVNHFYWPNVG